MGAVGGVGGGVGEHGFYRGDQRLEADETREDGLVADGVGEDERGALGDLVREELGGAGVNAGADRSRLGGGAKFLSGEFLAAGLSGDGYGSGEIADFLAFADAGVRESETDFVAIEAEIAGGLGHEVGGFVVAGAFGFEPAGVELERRTHDGAAAALVEPIALGAGGGKVGRVHECDAPFELGATGIAGFQFGPRGLGPRAPGRDNFKIVGDFHAGRGEGWEPRASTDEVVRGSTVIR